MINLKGRVSAVIVTYKRPAELKNCLECLIEQTYPPSEIIVIDNASSINNLSKEICELYSSNTVIKYILNKSNSLPAGRNLGVRNSLHEYILLVDDDVILDSKYIEKLLKKLENQQDLIGIQGYIQQNSRSWVREAFHRFFCHYYLEKNNCRVQKSISTTYPSGLSKDIECQWISGSNQLYRREVLELISWDEKLVRYADGEDLDHSYRVYNKNLGKLMISPDAVVYHNEGETGRTETNELTVMREVYGWYLCNKLFPSSHVAKIYFVWSRFGRFVFALLNILRYRNLASLACLGYLVRAYYFVWRNRFDFSCGNFESYNKRFNY